MTPTFAERVGRSARRSDGQLTIEVSETGSRDIASIAMKSRPKCESDRPVAFRNRERPKGYLGARGF
jgi:hypothetical protein